MLDYFSKSFFSSMPGHSIVWAAFKSCCEVKPPLYRGAHFALLHWAPVCRLWSNPPPQILSPPWKLKPPRCKRDAYNQPATKFVSQGFRNSGNPGQRCISEMVSSPSAPHSPCRRRGYWSHNRAIFQPQHCLQQTPTQKLFRTFPDLLLAFKRKYCDPPLLEQVLK